MENQGYDKRGNEDSPAGSQPAVGSNIPALRQGEGVNTNTAGKKSGGAGNSTGAAGSWGAGDSTGTGSGGASGSTGAGSGGAGDSTYGRPDRHNDPSSLKDAEESAGDNDRVGKGYTGPRSNSTGRRRSKFKTGRRRKILVGGSITGGVVGGVVFALFSITSGPLQPVHFAQLLQGFHMRANEDFGSDRTSKVLIYGLLGKGGERGRLSIPGNRAANSWEKRLIKDTGLRPVYSQTTRRFVGFEIADENKAFNTLLDNTDKNTKTTKNLERVMGNGAEIRTAAEASAGRQEIVRGGKGEVLDGKTHIIDLRNVKFKDRRIFIKTVGKFTTTNRVTSAIASRLLIKRAGVDFHPLHNIKRRGGDKLADYRNKLRQDRAKKDSEGTKGSGLGHNEGKDKDGKPLENNATAGATDESNSVIDKAKSAVGREDVKNIAKKLGKGGAVVGILCAAKSIGGQVLEYKYANDALPMMRMGMSAISRGNQVMSGKDLNADELGAYNQAFYDKKSNTSWTQAKSIQAELGQKQTGPDLPPEARLSGVNDKPQFFDVIDSIPVLGTVCGATDAVAGLPVIGDVLNASSEAIVGAVDLVAGTFGTSTDEIMTSALSAVAGKSVNTLASGAEYGNLANTGAFLSGNDNARSMGGAQLSPSDVATLKTDEKIADAEDNATKSIAERYLNPYDNHTLVASLIDRMPASSGQIASLTSNIPTLISSSFSSFANVFTPHAAAATQGYNYGVPKYGFSAAERANPEFDDPYQNAAVIEKPGVLDSLNEKYGKACFGMTVGADDAGVHVQSEDMGSENLNVFKVTKKDECNPQKNKDEMFLRYRFYLADAISTETADCYEGSGSESEQSCTDIGFPEKSSAGKDGSGGAVSGDAVELAKKILANSKITYLQDSDGDAKQPIQDTAAGKCAKTGEGKCVAINIKVLQTIADAGSQFAFRLHATVDGTHHGGSSHYFGVALDTDPEHGPAIAKIAASKYGAKWTGGSCAGVGGTGTVPDGPDHCHIGFGKSGLGGL